jgi:hypothetical protein
MDVKEKEGSVTVDLIAPKHVIASRLSVKPETLSRSFKYLINQDCISISKKRIEIKDIKKFRDLFIISTLVYLTSDGFAEKEIAKAFFKLKEVFSNKDLATLHSLIESNQFPKWLELEFVSTFVTNQQYLKEIGSFLDYDLVENKDIKRTTYNARFCDLAYRSNRVANETRFGIEDTLPVNFIEDSSIY